MMKTELLNSVKHYADKAGIPAAALASFIEVETGGRGFADNGKLIIQFEPAWYRRLAPRIPSGKWSINKVDVQSKEWEAFNDAFVKDPDAAMESTSIGLGQIMGFHYKRLGYKTVGEMWDDAKKGEDAQIGQLVNFIKGDPRLQKAIAQLNWSLVATIYNGAGYKALAEEIGREPYDVSMAKAYLKYKDSL